MYCFLFCRINNKVILYVSYYYTPSSIKRGSTLVVRVKLKMRKNVVIQKGEIRKVKLN